MDTHTDTDIHLTRGDNSQDAQAEHTHERREREPRDTVLSEDLVPDSHILPSLDMHPATIDGDIEAYDGQGLTRVSKSDQAALELQSETSKKIDVDVNCAYPPSNLDRDTLPATPKEVFMPERTAVPNSEPTSLTNINDAESEAIVCSQQSPSFHARMVSSSTPPHDEVEANPDGPITTTWMLHTVPDHVETTGSAHPADDEETNEDDFLRSLPPSSSPPQLFSSSPYVSSQSSDDGVEPQKALVDEPHDDDHHLDSKVFHHEIADVPLSSDTNELGSQMGFISCDENDLEHTRKRVASPDELHGSPPTKCLRLDSCLDPPPAPKRATLASQHRQYKKLAAPFRPPLKLPAVAEEPARATNNRKVETAINNPVQVACDKIVPKGPTISLQHKTSRPATQFKSPLVNGILPADARTIRLTPALQALERKLQLLKRATKVKDNNDEETLTRLAEKWIEAGREIAYDVWDATKESGDFTGKATFPRRSHGWQSTEGNTSWGWDTKPENASEEPRDIDLSEVSCATGRPAAEEDNDIGCNTLGIMLRQLGIAPEIFGWDDDREAFAD